jgi:hypothetical protein
MFFAYIKVLVFDIFLAECQEVGFNYCKRLSVATFTFSQLQRI